MNVCKSWSWCCSWWNLLRKTTIDIWLFFLLRGGARFMKRWMKLRKRRIYEKISKKCFHYTNKFKFLNIKAVLCFLHNKLEVKDPTRIKISELWTILIFFRMKWWQSRFDFFYRLQKRRKFSIYRIHFFFMYIQLYTSRLLF